MENALAVPGELWPSLLLQASDWRYRPSRVSAEALAQQHGRFGACGGSAGAGYGTVAAHARTMSLIALAKVRS